LILQQLREIQENQSVAPRLDGAKNFLIGSFPRTGAQGDASFRFQFEFYGLGLDYR